MLISFAVFAFVFAYAKIRFSHDVAHFCKFYCIVKISAVSHKNHFPLVPFYDIEHFKFSIVTKAGIVKRMIYTDYVAVEISNICVKFQQKKKHTHLTADFQQKK